MSETIPPYRRPCSQILVARLQKIGDMMTWHGKYGVYSDCRSWRRHRYTLTPAIHLRGSDCWS